MTNQPHPFPNLAARSKEGGGLYVGNAYWREVEAGHAMAMQALVGMCAGMGIRIRMGSIINDAMITRARARAASEFLESQLDVLVTIDSDIEFDPYQLLRMAEETFEHSLVGGAYAKRSGHSPELAIRLKRPASGIRQIVFADGEPLAEVEYLATGFMAVHRRVFEKVRDHYNLELQHQSTLRFYPFYDSFSVTKDSGEIFRLSEDWAFCERASQVGFPCMLDPRVRLRHWGLYDFTLEDVVRAERPEPGIIVWEYKDGVERFGYTPQEIWAETSDGFPMRVDPSDKVISQKIRETGEWEPEVAAAIRKHVGPDTKFLDLGAYIGYFSLLAAHLGAEVIAAEPNPEALLFLVASAEKANKGIVIRAGAASNVSGKYTLNTQGLANKGEPFLALLNEKTGPTVEVGLVSELVHPIWQPDVIKMDIEGEEWNAIQGSPEIFQNAKVVIFEVSDAQLQRNSQATPDMLVGWFIKNGFETKLLASHSTYEDWIAIKV